jgi:hypothetical protein
MLPQTSDPPPLGELDLSVPRHRATRPLDCQSGRSGERQALATARLVVTPAPDRERCRWAPLLAALLHQAALAHTDCPARAGEPPDRCDARRRPVVQRRVARVASTRILITPAAPTLRPPPPLRLSIPSIVSFPAIRHCAATRSDTLRHITAAKLRHITAAKLRHITAAKLRHITATKTGPCAAQRSVGHEELLHHEPVALIGT